MSDRDQALHRRLDEQPSVRPARLSPSPTGAGSRSAPTRPTALTVTDLAELQRIAGNAAVTTLVRPGIPGPRTTLQRASVAKGEGAQTWVRPGDTGPDVTKAQQRLNAIGAPGTPLAESGVYDAAMRSTVTRFQTAHGLDPDGIVGPLTYEAMDREDSAARPRPSPSGPITRAPPTPRPRPRST